MDFKRFLESIISNTYHNIDSIAEMLDIHPQELSAEDLGDNAKKALMRLFYFLEEYSLISDGILIEHR